MSEDARSELVPLDVDAGLWDRVYRVAPLVLIGTREGEAYDLAPKHLALPLSWEDHYGFVCSPRHATYHNVKRTGEFTVSYPRPSQVVLASLAAAPREGWESDKPVVRDLPTMPGTRVDAPLLVDAYFQLECELDRIVDDFGPNSLIAGRVVAAHATRRALIVSDRDPDEQLARSPLLAYVDPGRFARIESARAFPFPAGFKK
ncbi:MAG: flavin reductase [Gemmatimonadota bacterium]|nr:flavin reductase [Gemmatimonadota bacterium]